MNTALAPPLKRLLLASGIALLLGSTATLADGRYDGGSYRASRPISGHAPYRYAPPRAYHYRGGPRYGYAPRARRHRHGDAAAWLFGGLVLGTLLYEANRPDTVVIERRQVVPYSSDDRVTFDSREDASPPGRRLLRDRDGRCYDVSSRSDGSEERIELSAAECAW